MSEPVYPDITVDLSNVNGNAISIVNAVKRKLPAEARAEFQREALSGDYDHVLQTCYKWVEVE